MSVDDLFPFPCLSHKHWEAVTIVLDGHVLSFEARHPCHRSLIVGCGVCVGCCPALSNDVDAVRCFHEWNKSMAMVACNLGSCDANFVALVDDWLFYHQ